MAWTESCLSESAKLTGVYVIHHGGSIKYVGKTGSPSMSYGMRLRREFQETASSGKDIYLELALLAVPPEIKVSPAERSWPVLALALGGSIDVSRFGCY
jgi:hypothetical protein